MTAEVAQNRWDLFCERVQDSSHGALVSILFQRPEGATDTLVRDVPLIRVSWDDKTDPCNNSLIIETGLPHERPTRHIIVEPIHLLLKHGSCGDRYSQLEIRAENGTTTLLFHPGLNPKILQGLELSYRTSDSA